MVNQDGFRQVGMTEQIDHLGAEPEAKCVAVLTPPTRHRFQRARFECLQVTEESCAAGDIHQRKGLNRT